MKVLFVVPYFDDAGVGVIAKNLIRSFGNYDKEIRFDVACLSDDIDPIETYQLNNLDNIYKIKRLKEAGIINFSKEINQILRKTKYDVIHIHTDLTSWIIGRCAKKAGVKIIIGHAHGQEFLHYPKFVTKLIEKPCQFLNRKYCTHWIGCSNESMQHMFGKVGELIPNYISPDKITYLDDNSIMDIKQNLDIPLDKTIIGYAGRLNLIKNAIFIPEIFKTYDMVDYSCVFCGAHYEETKAKFEEYSIEDKAKFLGFRTDMDKLFNLFDIYVCPSFSEGMSMSLIQSQMMGIPCVVSKGVPKINDLGVGLFIQCKSYDTLEWKNAINSARDLIGSKSQDEIKRLMKINKVDEESIINDLLGIYKN